MGEAWRRDVVLQAVRDWLEEHSRLPTWTEWEADSERRPAARTIQRRWGWHELLAEATGESREQLRSKLEGQRCQWSDIEVLEALEADGKRIGRAPTWQEWERSSEPWRPTAKTVSRRFGGWGVALKRAGLDPTPRPRSEAWRRRRVEVVQARVQRGSVIPEVLFSQAVQERIRSRGFTSLEDYVRRRYVEDGISQIALASELFGRPVPHRRPEIGKLLDALGLRHRRWGGSR